MKILLINPATPKIVINKEYVAPLSLLYLASTLQENDIDVNVLDLNTYNLVDNVYENIIIREINDFEPSLVGITCLFSGQFSQVLKLSKKIKRTFNDLPIVLGGIHPTMFPEEILSHVDSIDWIVLDEGERTLLQLVKMLENKSYSFNEIDGFAYRENGNVIINKKTSFIEDLDNLAIPAYNLINIEDYYLPTCKNWINHKNLSIKTTFPILTSRSCPMRCTFCSMYLTMGPKHRKRSPQNVVDEIEYLYQTYENQHFSFYDDNLTMDKAGIIKICHEIIKRNIDIHFETPNGVGLAFLDEEIIDALMKAGLTRTTLAIESGSNKIRKIMGKHFSNEKIFEIVNIMKKYKKLYVMAFFIIGMPEDTRETLDETYNMIKAIDVDFPHISNLLVLPHTKIFEQCLRDDLFIEKFDVENYWKTCFYFKGNKRFFIKPYNLSVDELHEYREKFDTLIVDNTKRDNSRCMSV